MAKKRLIALSVIALAVASVVSSLIVWRPRRFESPIVAAARERKLSLTEQLRACDSLEAITRQYRCYTVTPERNVYLSPDAPRDHTYVSVFPDGRWIACVGALGYGPEEMLLLARDSIGTIRAFMYVPMGRLSLKADTLEKAYEELLRRAREVPIDR